LWSATDPNIAAPIQVILNVKTGDTNQVGGVGVGDEVWFNSVDGNYYTASSTSPLRPLDLTIPAADAQCAAILGVIDARNETVLQLVPTFNVPAVVLARPRKHRAFGRRRRKKQACLRTTERQQRLSRLLDRVHRGLLARRRGQSRRGCLAMTAHLC
jgi:hypothetical protein